MRHFYCSRLAAVAMLLSAYAADAWCFSFGNESVSGNFDSTISAGFGVRTEAPSSDLILQGNQGGPAGKASTFSALGDQGTLNYGKGDFFTAYLKGSHELLLKLPEQVSFMARANWLRDFAATPTTGNESVAASQPGFPFDGRGYSDGLADDARRDLRFKARLLDLWVSKTFDVGDQQARLRVGQQVINWGESLFASGGINATNPVDIMRLSQPGTQLKEAILPTPAVSMATGLGKGFNVEAYYQTRWKPSYFPPTGSYWSVVNGLGKGEQAYGWSEEPARNSGQWGTALHYRPTGSSVDVGFYAVNYHDKTPQLHFKTAEIAPGVIIPTEQRYVYPENRKLIGISANFPVGDWAVGTELSYRPKEAVFLNPNVSLCASQGGNCWVDEKKYQWHLTGLRSLSKADANPLLDLLHADNALFLAELVVVRFPNLKQSYGGDLVAAGGWGWGQETDATATPKAVGSKTSSGVSMDFSWTYDGSVIPGWQVTPEIFYSWSLSGHTPTIAGNYMRGAQSANLLLTFTRNPATWQFGLNYAMFWGGSSVLDQPLADRDYFGAYASFNF